MHITLITGGARSGKSDHAQKLAADIGAPVTFIATAEAGDEEMAERIRKHRADRPSGWTTIEASRRVADALRAAATSTVIIDCVTLLVSNVLLAIKGASAEEASGEGVSGEEASGEGELQQEIDDLLAAAGSREGLLIIVTNEVGLGVVPATELGRRYRDLLGAANRTLAAAADDVLLMVSGIPVAIKRGRGAPG